MRQHDRAPATTTTTTTLVHRSQYCVRPPVIVGKGDGQCRRLSSSSLWTHHTHTTANTNTTTTAITQAQHKPGRTTPGSMLKSKCWCAAEGSQSTKAIKMFTQCALELQCASRVDQFDRLGRRRRPPHYQATRQERDHKDSSDTTTANNKTRHNSTNNPSRSCRAGPSLLTQIQLLTLCLCLICNVCTCICSPLLSALDTQAMNQTIGMATAGHVSTGVLRIRNGNYFGNETNGILYSKHSTLPRRTRSVHRDSLTTTTTTTTKTTSTTNTTQLPSYRPKQSRKKPKRFSKRNRKRELKVIKQELASPSPTISYFETSSPLSNWSKSSSSSSSSPLSLSLSHHQHQQHQQQHRPHPQQLASASPSVSMLQTSQQSSQMKPPYVRSSDLTAREDDVEVGRPAAKNITAQVGHPVYMHCVVNTLADKMVSWIRLRDFHLLTIGTLTYIQDDRFALRYKNDQQTDWALQIKDVTVKDEGLYECQINSDPPRSQYYYLHVVVPVSEIIGNPDIFVRLNSPINLTCLISSSPEPPSFVFWYHNNRMINYDYNTLSQGQISVQKDPKKKDVVISRLLIKRAQLDDSGNYTCSPSNAEPASAYVHVLQGEKRLSSNQIQNDWSQTEPTLTNEGHHSGQCARWRPQSTLAGCWNMFIVLLFTFASCCSLYDL